MLATPLRGANMQEYIPHTSPLYMHVAVWWWYRSGKPHRRAPPTCDAVVCRPCPGPSRARSWVAAVSRRHWAAARPLRPHTRSRRGPSGPVARATDGESATARLHAAARPTRGNPGGATAQKACRGPHLRRVRGGQSPTATGRLTSSNPLVRAGLGA